MEQIKINPMKASERERLNKLYKIGPYREWQIDADAIKRIAEIDKLALAGEVTMHPVKYIKTGVAGRKPGGTNSMMGKKQWERKQEQLIHELNNG